ncbi:hypothetical protein L873DRAFT_1845620 [Choiromyces venosus 120613-1]|uniref:DDE-1 domain-containing protein n=1 Tax=Choiromyces venosus 120613-1 TaxID=1336337 RepID=A0A3N4JHU3_9PEZI|nr:hypothetical protein L873DRAFT_1845620 [Choiromyces venosus 120613-1]
MSDQMAWLESKQWLDRTMEWLEEESSEMASTAAKMFNVNPLSIQTHQLRKRHQERNSHEEDVKDFFVEYQNTLSKYVIKIGCPTGEIVIVPTQVKEVYTASSENHKSLTIIETICVDGRQPPPPVIICPGEKIMENWIQDNLTGAEVITVSPTGYTNECIALTFQLYTIKNSFHESGMFPVSYKMALKKMHHYNKRKPVRAQSGMAMTSESTSNTLGGPSVEEGGDLELPTLPSTYFECQKGIGEWIDHAESFSPTSNTRFQQWAKGTQISLAQAELQQQTYQNVQLQIQEKEKGRSKSRQVVQKGGVITVEAARLKQQEKAEKEKATAIKKAQKNIQIAVNKAKASLNCRGIAARKAEKIRGEIVPAEMLVTIPDPERNPSPEDLESLQAPPDPLQALLLLEPTPASATSTIDPQLLTLDFEEEDIEIYTTRREAEQRYTTESASGENSFTVDDGEDLTGESDSDSSCISSDSIIRNADFVSLN